MGWKTFGKRNPMNSARRVLKMFRMIHGSSNSKSCSPSGHEDHGQCDVFNVQAYMARERRMHEVEAEKALAIALSRHERWKAGGPV